MDKIGFTLGKFMPPHLGHLHLIREGARRVEKMYVLMCSIEAESIPGYLRYTWLKKIFAGEKNIEIIHVTDENPQQPADHPGFWDIWQGTFNRNLPKKPDIFFSSELYGFELEKKLGIRHQLIDLDRKNFPVSARHIRENPLRYWNFIPDVIKPFYTKKIVLTGPESVGKSVLAEKLARHFNTNFLPEYGREYYESLMPHFNEMGISHIAGGHLALEEKALLLSNKILFLDTDLIVTQLWGEIYFNNCAEWIIRANHQPSQQATLYLLLAPDVEWVDDGTRNYKEIREAHFLTIKKELEKRRLNYEIISGSYENRFARAVECVEKLMAGEM